MTHYKDNAVQVARGGALPDTSPAPDSGGGDDVEARPKPAKPSGSAIRPATASTARPQSDARPAEFHRSKTPVETSARALQIIAAADELLSERGPDQVSMRDVAERAGVNKALIFYYFGSRTQLFEKVLERYYRNHARTLATAFAVEGTPLERVRKAIDAYLDFMDTNHLFARLVMQEVAHHDNSKLPQIRANLVQVYDLMRAEFADLLPADGPLSAKHFFVTLAGAVIHYYTYAKVMRDLWSTDPSTPESLRERRTHVQWLAETIVTRLLEEAKSRP